MTPEQLENYIAAADAQGLAKAVQFLTEVERIKLSRVAANAYTSCRKKRQSFLATAIIGHSVIFRGRINMQLTQYQRKLESLEGCCRTARLAVFAFCPISAVRRVDAIWWNDPFKDLLIQILIDRRPDWADQWIEQQLKQAWPAISWQDVQHLVRSGTAARSTSDAWIRSMVRDLPERVNRNDASAGYVPLTESLKKQPELLRTEIWRLFEVETPAFAPEYCPDRRGPDGYETWSRALRNLADEGLIDRQRLIDGALAGLTAGFTNRDTLSHYMKFHDFLEPTQEELLARQQNYLNLLTHSATHVVSFALDRLKTINKSRKLDDVAFTAASGALLTSRVKSQSNTALTLLKQIVKRSPHLRPAIVLAAINGLSHESPDVQEQTLACLGVWLKPDDTVFFEMVRSRLANLASPLQAAAQELLNKAGPQAAPAPETPAHRKLAASREQLYERMQSLDPRVTQLAGVDAVRRAIENNTEYPPLAFDMYDVPILSGLDPITPIQTVDELIEAVAHAVEHVDSADEVERILDAISRLCNDKPDAFDTRAVPLLKRIIDVNSSAARDGLVTSEGAPVRLYPLLCAWLCEQAEFATPRHYANNPSPVFIMDERLLELGLRVLEKQAAPLLAAPTHEKGWIDPRVFVQRLLDQQDNGLDVLRYDFTQALLRLAPDHRGEALQQAAPLNGVIGDIVRWALGTPHLPRKLSKEHAGPWITAARARSPKCLFERLHKFASLADCPDGVSPAQHEWRAYTTEQYNKWSKTTSIIPRLELSNGFDKAQQKITADVPTSLLHIQGREDTFGYDGYGVHRPWLVNWCQMIWPQNIDAFCAAAIREMMARLEMTGSVFDPNFAYFQVFFEPDRPLTEMSTLMLWLGIAGKDADVRAHAAEALAETIHDGRAHPEPLSAVLIKLASGGWLKLNRLASALADVARLSPLHQLVIARTLARWLAAQNELPRDAHHVLALLLELLAALGLPLDPAARKPLKSITGKSKTATLARRLLNLTPTEPTPAFTQANLLQLQARINRAERWS